LVVLGADTEHLLVRLDADEPFGLDGQRRLRPEERLVMGAPLGGPRRHEHERRERQATTQHGRPHARREGRRLVEFMMNSSSDET
jgi:hypothetical protein